ncbi:MAG TPA: hypothetical protein VE890_02860 [Thermoguttaceae bacterium]|nr:hypothetical protein [Thermoguttaceae bacterium]
MKSMDLEGASRQSPFVEATVVVEPQESRLSIMHLILWMACVALYFSFVRITNDGGPGIFYGHSDILWILTGLGLGTTLTGLVAIASRWLRGFSLTKDPGDYLLLSSGTSLVFSVVGQVMIVLLIVRDFFQYSPAGLLSIAVYVVLHLVNILILLFAAVQVTSRRWRVSFLVGAIAAACPLFTVTLIAFAKIQAIRDVGIISSQFVSLIAIVVVTVVVLMDIRGHERYPWQHWLGVGAWLWLNTISFGSFMYWMFWF